MSLQTCLEELRVERDRLAAELKKFDFGIAAIEQTLEDEKPRPRRKGRRQARRRRAAPKRRARSQRPKREVDVKPEPASPRPGRFVPICLEHKTVVIKDGADYKCTTGGHIPKAFSIKDTQTNELFGSFESGQRASQGATRRNAA